jgi:hypothetical protein
MRGSDEIGSSTFSEEDSEIEEVSERWAEARGITAAHVEEAIRQQFQTARGMVRNEKEEKSEAESNDNAGGEEKLTQAAELVRYAEAEGVHLFADAERDVYVSIALGCHVETYPLRNKDFKLWLIRKYYERNGKPPGSQALQDALDTLAAKALFDGGECCAVHIRLAEHAGKIYLDLGDEEWQVVEIDTDGWRVIKKSPVKFIRKRGMQALPLPTEGGTLADLRPLVNVPDDNLWLLLLTWIVAALRPSGPYGVLILHGEAGACKSSLTRMLRRLIDPNKAALRPKPKTEHDLVIAASNGWVCAFDNLSFIDQDMSDALCRLATGAGFATRKLYTDDEEVVFEVQRPVIINSIGETATKSDLLDRGLILQLPYVADEERLDERELRAKFDAISGAVLGALLAALSSALKGYSSVELTSKPRMADFAKWGCVAASALGWDQEKFLAAYKSNREIAQSTAREASSGLSDLLVSLLKDKDEWEGLASSLLGILRSRATEEQVRSKGFPKTSVALGKALTRIAPAMRTTGIAIDRKHSDNGTVWKLTKGLNSFEA